MIVFFIYFFDAWTHLHLCLSCATSGVTFSTSLVAGRLEPNAKQGGFLFESNIIEFCMFVLTKQFGMLDCCRPIDAESKEEDLNQLAGPVKGPGPSVAPGSVSGPGPSVASGPVSRPGPSMDATGAVAVPGPSTAPSVSTPTEDLLQSKVSVQIESASDDWVRTYAQQGWHIIAVHALHDPASVQIGREHPGLHPGIMEAAVSSPHFQRYMHLNLHITLVSVFNSELLCSYLGFVGAILTCEVRT